MLGWLPKFRCQRSEIFIFAPRQSIRNTNTVTAMLLKATAGVPHEGGQRTKIGEKYYEMLRAWISDDAKLDLKAPRVAKIEVSPRDPVVQQIGAQDGCRASREESAART